MKVVVHRKDPSYHRLQGEARGTGKENNETAGRRRNGGRVVRAASKQPPRQRLKGEEKCSHLPTGGVEDQE